MRGRKPRPFTLSTADVPILQGVARSRYLPSFQVQHARIVLAVAAGEPIQMVASRMECDRATVWRVCRRYEVGGLKKLLLDEPRAGRPQEISPPPARSDRRTGLSGTDRRGLAHYPLDQRRPGSSSHHRRHPSHDQSPYSPANSARRRFATTPYTLLENRPSRCTIQGARRESALVLRKRREIGPAGHLDGSGR